ncbi:MAG: hypothetical protein J6A19_06565 [Oscillospiraceae bacterium]|nr:hypothetical protein [Oscillospiraceae bacterium]
MDTYDFDELMQSENDASSRPKKPNSKRNRKLECENLSLFDETIEPDSSESCQDDEEHSELEEDDDNDLYDENDQPREHTFVVGDKVMTCIFPKRLFKDDYEPTSQEKLLKIFYQDEWAEAYRLYQELMDEYYLGSEQVQQMQNGDNPVQYPFSEEQPTGIDRIKNRFEGMVAEFDIHNKPALVKELPLDIKKEYIYTELFDRIKSKGVFIKSKKNISGSIDENEFSYWAIKPFKYTRHTNNKVEIYNYYEIYSKDKICCIICETKSLKNTLDNNGCVYDHAIITKQILESAKHLPDKEVTRTFEFHWFEHAIPINEPVVLSDSEVNQLLGLSRKTQELIFTVLGYSVLALIAPDMSEKNKIKAIHIAEREDVQFFVGDDSDTKPNAKSKKKNKNNNSVISHEIVKTLQSIASACFVLGGGCDLSQTMYVDVKTSDRAVSELCERRIVLLDTINLRGYIEKDQKMLQEILGEYLQYADQFEPKKFPTPWLPLVIGKDEFDDRFYNLTFKERDMAGVTEVTPVLRNLYRNALVGTSSGDFSKLREQVIAWSDEIETKRNADGTRRTYFQEMTDYLYACCRYTAAGNEELVKVMHSAFYDTPTDTPGESISDDDANPETESTPKMTENCAKVIDAIFALVREHKITEERNADNPDMAAFIYTHKGVRCVCLGDNYLSNVIADAGIVDYTCEDFVRDCDRCEMLEKNTPDDSTLTVKINKSSKRFTAVKFPDDSE